MAKGGGGPTFHTTALLYGLSPNWQENKSYLQDCFSALYIVWNGPALDKNPWKCVTFSFFSGPAYLGFISAAHSLSLCNPSDPFNYFLQREMWNLFHFLESSCLVANPAKFLTLQKRELWELSQLLGVGALHTTAHMGSWLMLGADAGCQHKFLLPGTYNISKENQESMQGWIALLSGWEKERKPSYRMEN